jgi:hypothetical protein
MCLIWECRRRWPSSRMRWGRARQVRRKTSLPVSMLAEHLLCVFVFIFEKDQHNEAENAQ